MNPFILHVSHLDTCVSLRCNMNRKGKPNDKSNLFSLPNAPCSIPSEKREKNKNSNDCIVKNQKTKERDSIMKSLSQIQINQTLNLRINASHTSW